MKRIKLRALSSNDIDTTLNWNNQEEISELYSGHPFPVNIEMEKRWYDKILTSNYPTSVFGIELIEKAKLIGLTILKDIHQINRSTEFAIYIGDNLEKGKGYSKEATLLTLQFAFFSLNLNRVFLKVLEENTTAISLYDKIGFKEEGILRESIFKKNQYKNEIIMSILKSEYCEKY